MVPRICKLPCLIICSAILAHLGVAQNNEEDSPYLDWVEPNFPFFSSVLDASSSKPGFSERNITPRGLILNLGNDHWVCFDTDLLRVAAIWQGDGVTPDALATKSYHPWGGKTPGGQVPLPRPVGDLWVANGIYPGWQEGNSIGLDDPRERAPSPEEVGRGPLSEKEGRFKAVRLVDETVVLEYSVSGAQVLELFAVTKQGDHWVVERHVEVGPTQNRLSLLLGLKGQAGVTLTSSGNKGVARLREQKSVWVARVPAHDKTIQFCVTYTETGPAPQMTPKVIPGGISRRRWPESVVTQAHLSTESASYVVDNIPIPLENPWRRNIRPGDVQFLSDGTGVLPSIDGDIWLAHGLQDSLNKIRWTRFASGLHEPMSVVIRNDEIYAFDKNGIWRLEDTNCDGEADVHELFSNAFAQTGDMREFPSTIRLAPEGAFIIAKGGQQKATLGKHNGSVLRISADGSRSEVLGYGFRQPSIGVNIRTGLVTSSDQEGQYIPSTPLHIVRDKQFYGYLSEGLHEREKYPAPIAEPLTWIPHAVNASAISQIWLFGAQMGALNDAFVHIGFNRPELFKVLLNNRGTKPQASVMSITTGFDFPPLNGSVNPVDGQLYIAGYQINGWGNALNKLSGLGRVRYTGTTVTLPSEIAPMDKGVLLRFDVTLDPEQADDPDSYSLASWSYVRTHRYGSAQYRADGEYGIDWLTPSSAYLSRDKRSVFIAVPEMKPVMQLRMGWSLKTVNGIAFEDNAYTTPYSLPAFDPVAEGFESLSVDLTPRAAAKRETGPVSVEEGRRLHSLMGCAACHSASTEDMAKVGPGWGDLYGSEREVVINEDRTTVMADDAYLRESILEPAAKVVRAFDKSEYAMPSYAGVLTDSQVESLVLFIKAIKEGEH